MTKQEFIQQLHQAIYDENVFAATNLLMNYGNLLAINEHTKYAELVEKLRDSKVKTN